MRIRFKSVSAFCALILSLVGCDDSKSAGSKSESDIDGGKTPDGAEPDGDTGPDSRDDDDDDVDGPDEPMDTRPEEPHPNTLPSDELFQCEGEPKSSPGRIRRIERMEWTRNIGKRPPDTAALNPLVPNTSHRFSSWSSEESLDPVTFDRFLEFAPMSVSKWDGLRDDMPSEIGCMYSESEVPGEACVRDFVDFYLQRHVLFRPASNAEKDRLVSFALKALADTANAGLPREAAMSKITSAAWVTSAALFRSELGVGKEQADGSTALDANELALAVAYTLSDWGPGAQSHTSLTADMLGSIRSAAEDGTILDPDVLASLIEEHYGGMDPERNDLYQDINWHSRRGEFWLAHKVQRFFREWLDYEDVNTIFKDTPAATSAHEDAPNIEEGYAQLRIGFYGYESTVDHQLDDMIARIVMEDNEVLRTLLTSRTFFLPSNLSDDFKSTDTFHYIYGYTADIPDDRAARWIELPEDERAGVLTHPAWLAAHGGNFDNDPSAVRRGLWVRENLLCGLAPDVPITVDASFPPSTDHLPARERLEMATGDASCQSCHQLMNPLGLPFEMYNHAGYLRAEDHGKPVDGSSTLVNTGDPMLDVQVANAVEMSELLAESQLVQRCFIRHVFRFFQARAETTEDACTLSAMEQAYVDSGGSFKALLTSLMTSPTFMHRHQPMEEEDQ